APIVYHASVQRKRRPCGAVGPSCKWAGLFGTEDSSSLHFLRLVKCDPVGGNKNWPSTSANAGAWRRRWSRDGIRCQRDGLEFSKPAIHLRKRCPDSVLKSVRPAARPSLAPPTGATVSFLPHPKYAYVFQIATSQICPALGKNVVDIDIVPPFASRFYKASGGRRIPYRSLACQFWRSPHDARVTRILGDEHQGFRASAKHPWTA